MNRETFLDKVENRLLGTIDERRRKIYDEILELIRDEGKNSFDENEIDSFIERITNIGTEILEKEPTASAQGRDGHKKNQPEINISSKKDILLSAILTEKITPWVEELRENLFGSKKAPLKGKDNAQLWLKGQREKSLQSKNPAEKYEVNKILGPLERESGEIARATGFYRGDLLLYVLGGTRPQLSKWGASISLNRHQLSDGSWLRNTEINVTFQKRNFSFRELHKAYLSIVKGSQDLPLSFDKKDAFYSPERENKHVRVFKLVASLGRPPGKTRGVWEPLRKKWNKQHPSEKYKHWSSLERAYDRILKRHPEYFSSPPDIVKYREKYSMKN